MSILKWTLIVVVALVLLIVAAGQMGLFSGRPPQHLGVRDGRLKAPSSTPNSVSSQAGLWAGHARRTQAQIAPLVLVGTGPETIARIQSIVAEMPSATIVEAREDYLYVRFTTRWLRFVDDAEFWFDPSTQVVQVRSASRVGRRDLDVNRQRIEAIRQRLSGG